MDKLGRPLVAAGRNTVLVHTNTQEDIMKEKKYWGIIKLALILVIVIIIAITAFQVIKYLQDSSLEITSNTVVDVTNLEQQILSIGELATVEYNYRDVITMTDSHSIGGWDIPLTQKSFIIVVEGIIKIGIDATDISINASDATKTITITIPKTKILSHEIDEDSVEVLEESSGLFNKVSIEDWKTMAVEKKQAMEDKVRGGDLFTRAENDAVRLLQTLIESVVPEDYTVTVKSR